MKRIAVAFILLLLAACSGGTDDTATTTTTASPATPGTDAATTTITLAVRPMVEPVGEVVHGSLETPDGRTRTYRLYRPSSVPDDAPLVVALHGGTGNGDQFARTSGYEGLAEANGFVVVFAEGTPTALGPRNLVWNAGGCCAAAVRDDVDDVGFLTALIDDLAESEGTDPGRTLVVGHSNGAMMAFRLACEAADHVAAIAVQAGTVFVDDCSPSRPVSVLDLHGAADTNLPLGGGVGPDSAAGVAFPPVREGLSTLAEAAGCEATTEPSRDGAVTTESWGPCPDGVAVELMAVEGAGHSWMGHPAPSERSDEPYADLDASAVTWGFLSAHR